jgi:hypothetical protein
MAKACLKVLKDSCCRLRTFLLLGLFMSRSLTAWSRRVSLAKHLLSVVSQALFCNFLCAGSSPFLSSGEAVDDC